MLTHFNPLQTAVFEHPVDRRPVDIQQRLNLFGGQIAFFHIEQTVLHLVVYIGSQFLQKKLK